MLESLGELTLTPVCAHVPPLRPIKARSLGMRPRDAILQPGLSTSR